MTVADHQPVTILIGLLGMGVDAGRHLRLQGDREHLPRSLAHDLIEQRTARLAGLGLIVDYLEHGRTLPTGAPTPAHDQTCYGLSIFLGKVRPFMSPRRGPSTGSDHCSRAATERAIAHLKTWLLSKEGGWFRLPLSKFETALKAIIGLFFFSNY